MKKIDDLVYILICFLIRCVGKIPIRHSIVLGCILGDVMRFIDNRHRKVALANLSHAYGCKMTNVVRRDIVKKVYRNLCQSLFEVAWLIGSHFKDIDELIQIEGTKNLLEAFSKGKGVLIVSGHIGAWELLPYIISRIGVVVNIVYRPLDYAPLDRFVQELRSMFGGRMISTKYAMPKIIQAINSGEAAGLLIDQSADWYNGVWVDFFGHRTCTSKGAARVALDTSAPVIPAFVFRERGEFKVCFKEAVPLTRTGDKTKDIEINTSNYTKVIEREICKRPEQWFWVHRRWKNKAYSPWSKTIV